MKVAMTLLLIALAVSACEIRRVPVGGNTSLRDDPIRSFRKDPFNPYLIEEKKDLAERSIRL